MHVNSSCDVTVSKSITLLDAMHILKVACQGVKQSSIVNWLGKAGFVPSCPEGDDQMEQPPDRLSAEDVHALRIFVPHYTQPDSKDETSEDPSPAPCQVRRCNTGSEHFEGFYGPSCSRLQWFLHSGEPSPESHH